MQIVEFDESDTQQRRFVYSAFCRGSDESADHLRNLLRHGARAVVALSDGADPRRVSEDDGIFGFALGVGLETSLPTLIWVYVKPVEVTDDAGEVHRLRGNGLAKRLLLELGLGRRAPFRSYYDNAAARRWVQRGWPILLPSQETEDARAEAT
jgi:hypothetical protein